MLFRVCPYCQGRWSGDGCCLPSPAAPVSREVPGLDEVWALRPYDAVTQRFVLAAKNGGRRDLLRFLGRELGSLAADLGVAHRPTVTWVPSSRSGQRRRGYDPARLLARALAHDHQLPMMPLLRRHGRAAQAGLPRGDRLAGPDLQPRLRTAPERVILVDDVITTGASLRAAAEKLRAAGTASITGLCVAAAP